MLSGHGDDTHKYLGKKLVNFSSNVYYQGFTVELQNHLSLCLEKVKNYPAPEAQELVNQLEEHHRMDKGQIIATNGATEAFYLIAQAFRGKSATIVVPSFAEYEDGCRANDIRFNFLNWEKLTTETKFSSELVFICNPNNPTGCTLSCQTIRHILALNKDSIFVIDEAYMDFTKSAISSIALIKELGNLIVVKSLTKTYAIPGLRLGYIISNREMTARINDFKMPWSVNVLAIEAGKFILSNLHRMKLPVNQILQRTQALIQRMNLIKGINAESSETNFFLCRTEQGSAARLKEFLIENYGILIRDASNFRTLTPHHFRIASQSEEENEFLVTAIEAWSKTI